MIVVYLFDIYAEDVIIDWTLSYIAFEISFVDQILFIELVYIKVDHQ
jgi:hypothetical protein